MSTQKIALEIVRTLKGRQPHGQELADVADVRAILDGIPTEGTPIKCAVCGLIYHEYGPYPACRSDNGPSGPLGMRPEELAFMKCVLGRTEPKEPKA